MARNDSKHFEEIPRDALSLVQLVNEFFPFRVEGTPDNGDPTARTLLFRQQPDGTLRASTLQTYLDENGVEQVARIGPDGQQFMGQWVYDSGGAAWVRMLGDANGNAYSREYTPSVLNPTPTAVAPYLLTNAWSAAWTPGGTAAELYEVTYEVVSVIATAVTFTVARDIGAGGGAPAITEYWSGLNEPLGGTTTSGKRTYRMLGNDQVQVICNGLNSAKIEFIVNRLL